MTAKKRQIAFYATSDVASWYERLPNGVGGRLINQIIGKHITETRNDPAVRDLGDVLVSYYAKDRIEKIETDIQRLQEFVNYKGELG